MFLTFLFSSLERILIFFNFGLSGFRHFGGREGKHKIWKDETSRNWRSLAFMRDVHGASFIYYLYVIYNLPTLP
jgi:hypothetical protein